MVGQNKGENCTMNRILIIDDDRELCALIKRSVQTENIAADFCNTGKEGLQKLKEQEYQLVILDVMMPGMDGFETLEEIRKEHSLPILMFTSKNDSISKVRGLRAGADDYLTKPFDMDELAKACAATDTLMEISTHHKNLTVEEIRIAAKYDVKFIISSDAHQPYRVGDFEGGLARAEAAGLDIARIVNLERTEEGET